VTGYRRVVSFPWGEATAVGLKRARVGDRVVPTVIDARFPSVDGQPALEMRVEVLDGVPECRELRLIGSPGGRPVQPRDLEAIRLTDLVDLLCASMSDRVVSEADGVVTVISEEASIGGALDAMRQARKGRGARRINRPMLEKVAEIYRDNIEGNPTAKVRDAFGVQQRTAALYVKRARDAGLLPPTTRGRKKA
jgi:hypothetical protein